MGIINNKSNEDNFQKEYFRIIKRDFTNSLKKIKNKLYIEEPIINNWINYLIEKFGNDEICQEFNILSYLENICETNEQKHKYNLTLFLSQKLDIISFGIFN